MLARDRQPYFFARCAFYEIERYLAVFGRYVFGAEVAVFSRAECGVGSSPFTSVRLERKQNRLYAASKAFSSL